LYSDFLCALASLREIGTTVVRDLSPKRPRCPRSQITFRCRWFFSVFSPRFFPFSIIHF